MERKDFKNKSGHDTVRGVASKVVLAQCAPIQVSGSDVKESRSFRSHLKSEVALAKKRFPQLEFFSNTSALSSSVGTSHSISDTDTCSDASDTVSWGSSTCVSQLSDQPVNKEFIKNGGYAKLFSEHLRKESSQLTSHEHDEFVQRIKKLYENSEYATLYRD